MLSFSFQDLMDAGGLAGYERRAAARAIREEREYWLPILEAYRATLTDEDGPLVSVVVDAEIRRLRRFLGRPASPSAEAIARRRERTRERVQRFRQRQKV